MRQVKSDLAILSFKSGQLGNLLSKQEHFVELKEAIKYNFWNVYTPNNGFYHIGGPISSATQKLISKIEFSPK